MRVGRSDFNDPVYKYNRCYCCCHCSCILGSGCELFTRDGASAVDEGQGRKIRKSRTEGFSGGRNRREWNGRNVRFWVEKTAVESHRRTITTGWRPDKICRSFGKRREEDTGKWENDILIEFILRRKLQCKRHYAKYYLLYGRYNAKVWMQIKYRIYCI